jgi:hypothetical protein
MFMCTQKRVWNVVNEHFSVLFMLNNRQSVDGEEWNVWQVDIKHSYLFLVGVTAQSECLRWMTICGTFNNNIVRCVFGDIERRIDGVLELFITQCSSILCRIEYKFGRRDILIRNNCSRLLLFSLVSVVNVDELCISVVVIVSWRQHISVKQLRQNIIMNSYFAK